MTQGRTFSDEDWLKLNYDFITGHRYLSQYGQDKLESSKVANILVLERAMNACHTDS